jgi:hypothetical protein
MGFLEQTMTWEIAGREILWSALGIYNSKEGRNVALGRVES